MIHTYIYIYDRLICHKHLHWVKFLNIHIINLDSLKNPNKWTHNYAVYDDYNPSTQTNQMFDINGGLKLLKVHLVINQAGRKKKQFLPVLLNIYLLNEHFELSCLKLNGNHVASYSRCPVTYHYLAVTTLSNRARIGNFTRLLGKWKLIFRSPVFYSGNNVCGWEIKQRLKYKWMRRNSAQRTACITWCIR